FGADTTFNNAASNIWVYDLTAGDTVPFTPGTPTATANNTSVSGSASLATFLLYSTSASTANRFGVNGVNVDEVRVGSNWTDVVVPEPSMFALIGIGMLSLFSLPRRNA
ncbi:MAG TPA: PEP-CTERM sorting domain-containing protein, partial [Lacipirellulaceae bacterium]|nr:PEP-CTERM sorting domain-containing protein [Lacipirellulaceae bacterium]